MDANCIDDMATKPFRCDFVAKKAVRRGRVSYTFMIQLTQIDQTKNRKRKERKCVYPKVIFLLMSLYVRLLSNQPNILFQFWIISISSSSSFSYRYDGVTDLSTAECYNPMTNAWQYITPMGTKRSCLGICSFDGLIYIGGGYDGASCLSSFERYDTLTGVWSSCPTMGTRRRYCRLAVVDNCIYALGGFDSSNYQASVEKLDPRVGRWMAVPSMTSRRSSCGVAALDGYLYCIGGNDGTMCMNSGM